MDDYWYDTWAYINDQGIAPLLIGEWEDIWTAGKPEMDDSLRDYMIDNRIHHTFWCINPNSGDTGGLLGNDWSTWDEEKYGLLKPALWQSGGKFIGLDHQIPLGKNGMSLSEYYGMSIPSTKPTTTNPTPTPTKPIESPTPSPTNVSFTFGDINDDGFIDSSDLTLLKRILLKKNPSGVNLRAADVNDDGDVDSTDLTILKRYVLRKISELPLR